MSVPKQDSGLPNHEAVAIWVRTSRRDATGTVLLVSTEGTPGSSILSITVHEIFGARHQTVKLCRGEAAARRRGTLSLGWLLRAAWTASTPRPGQRRSGDRHHRRRHRALPQGGEEGRATAHRLGCVEEDRTQARHRRATSDLFSADVHAEASTKASDAIRHFMIPIPQVPGQRSFRPARR